MKLLKTLAAGVALLACMSASNAALVTVAGVTWDPDWVAGGFSPEKDWNAKSDFTQWFSTSTNIAPPSASTAVNFGTIAAYLAGSGPAADYYLTGVGEVFRMNDPARNVLTSSATGGGVNSFCNGCELTYVFGGIKLNQDGSFDTTNGYVKFYVDTTPDFAPPPTSQGDINKAVDGLLWLDLKVNSLSLQSGSVANGQVGAVLEVIGGAAQYSFDPKFINYTATAFFESLDSPFSNVGIGSAIGNSIPEPASLALVGLGLVGAGLVRRRKSVK